MSGYTQIGGPTPEGVDEFARSLAQAASMARNASYAKPAANYQTPLSPEDEARFRNWVQTVGAPFAPDEPVTDYDMRGYWKAKDAGGPSGTAVNPCDGQLHFPDTYKTPYHQSFSAESVYAAPGAPDWVNDHQLVEPATGRVVFDEASPPQKPGVRSILDLLAGR